MDLVIDLAKPTWKLSVVAVRFILRVPARQMIAIFTTAMVPPYPSNKKGLCNMYPPLLCKYIEGVMLEQAQFGNRNSRSLDYFVVL